MKANFWKISALVIVAGLAAVACKPEKVETQPVVTITASSTSFASNSATVNINLSAASTKAVGVKLDATGNLASALTFNKDVAVAAGSTSLPVTITANSDGLAPGSYSAEIAIVSATGAEVSTTAKSVTLTLTVAEPEPEIVKVNMDSPAEFADGKAVLKLYPDAAPEKDITVTLAVGTKVSAEGATLIPESALTFNKTATIPAGSDADVEVAVSVDVNALESGLNEAVIVISNVSEGGEIGDKSEAHITTSGLIKATNRTDWTITYNGTQGGYDIVSYIVGSETQKWYAFYYTKGEVAAYFDSMDEYVRYMAYEEVNPYVGTEDAYTVRTGDVNLRYNPFAVGEYEFFLLGADADGYITGDYATLVVKREATNEMKAAYEDWLGEWEIAHKIWTVEKANEAALTYKVSIAGVNNSFEAGLGWNREFEIRNQEEIAENIGFVGLTSSYNFWYGSFVVASAAYPTDGATTLDAANTPDGSGGKFAYLSFVDFSQMSIIALIGIPVEMARPSDIVTDDTPVKAAAYNDFIGTWDYNGYTIVIAQKEAGSTYTVSGMGTVPAPFGGNVSNPEAVFDSSNGTMYMMEQVLGSWTYAAYGFGDYMISATNDLEYPEWRWSWGHTDAAKIFTASMHQSGNVTLAGGTIAAGPVKGIIGCWMITDTSNANVGKGNWGDPFIINEAAMVPASSGAGAPALKSVSGSSRISATRKASTGRGITVRAMNTR